MTEQYAREWIRNHAGDYLQRDKSRKGYVCPVCGSGSGKNGTGITTKDGTHFTCWAGCFSNSDLIDIIGVEHKIDGYKERLEKACEIFKITIDGKEETGNTDTHMCIHTNTYTYTHTENNPPEEEKRYTEYLRQAESRIKEPECVAYLSSRGISIDTAIKNHLGYDPEWRHPKRQYDEPSKRLIIPTSEYSYLARYISGADNGQQKMKCGSVRIFNSDVLEQAEHPVFVVEGEIDAISISEVGEYAVALGSVSYIRKFIEIIKEKNPALPLIIALDNDDAGRDATKKLSEELNKVSIPYRICNPYGEHKDANDALKDDREKFMEEIKKTVSGEETTQAELREQYKKQNCVAEFIDAFTNDLSERASTPCISTGYKKLDEELDSGLYEGLYIVGAIPSLGKTTYVLQMADYIAQQGRDVLIFSLEMSRFELMAKSISRHTAQEEMLTKGIITENAKTVRGITDYNRYGCYTQEELDLIGRALVRYKNYAEHLYIIEGMGDVSAKVIREKVEHHINMTDSTPVVIVDYLQNVMPLDIRATDKQNVDMTILEFKRISRDYKLPLICISSLNRGGYKTNVAYDAFKESGSIEYGADVLLGMQLDAQGDECSSNEMINQEKAKDPRDIMIRVLKNRNGKTGGEVRYRYYTKFNLFEEVQE